MENESFAGPNIGAARSQVPAVARAIQILDVISDRGEGMGVSEIARTAGLSKSTVHGILTTLASQGLIVAADGTRGYALGPRLVELGARALDRHVLEQAEGVLPRLAAGTGQTAFLGRRAGRSVVILARHETGLLNLSAPVGLGVPLMAGALGKAYLASLPESTALHVLEVNPPARFTDRSETDLTRYMSQVRATRSSGFAVDRGEYLPGICAVASVIPRPVAVYFLWLVGIDANYDDVALQEAGWTVRETAASMLVELDGAEQRGQGVRDEAVV